MIYFCKAMAPVRSRNILKITVLKLSLVKSNGVHQPLTESYPMKNILDVMLLRKRILLIFSQVNKKNQGQFDMIIIEDSHQAIISQEMFEAVQNLKGNITNKEININGICF